MAFQLSLPPIVRLSGRKCLVVNGWAEVDYSDPDEPRIVSMSSNCVITDDGYEVDEQELWPGAVRERLHPWPPTEADNLVRGEW